MSKKSKREYRALKLEVFTHYGLECARCANDDLDILSIDHIWGGAADHKKHTGVRSGVALYRWLRNEGYPPGFRTLCLNCQHKVYLKMRVAGL